MKKDLAIFEGHEIRRLYDEKTETWFFSVVDIIRVLTQQPDYQASRKYWKVLKGRLAKEGSQLVSNCYQLKMAADDGKQRLTDVANAETLLRLVQSVPSPKAEPIKLWLARVGYERMQEMSDPARALERARATCGQSQRDCVLQPRVARDELPWVSRRKLNQPQRGCGGLGNEEATTPLGLGKRRFMFTQGSSFLVTLGFGSESLWDSSAATFTALAELSTRQIAETVNATGLPENKAAAQTGGKIARRARLELEAQTGKRVVTGENYLPPGSSKKIQAANKK